MDLDDFFDTYRAMLIAGDVEGLGRLYTENAVFSSIDGPDGDQWQVGREAIVAGIRDSLTHAKVRSETPPTTPYDRRGDDLAARFGTFEATAEPVGGGHEMNLTVRSIEIFAFDPVEGWRYLADETQILSITTTRPGPT